MGTRVFEKPKDYVRIESREFELDTTVDQFNALAKEQNVDVALPSATERIFEYVKGLSPEVVYMVGHTLKERFHYNTYWVDARFVVTTYRAKTEEELKEEAARQQAQDIKRKANKERAAKAAQARKENEKRALLEKAKKLGLKVSETS